jgi:hypothetical protein
MPAEPRNALATLEGFELEFVQVNDFATLAETAFHQEARQRFLAFVGSRKVDLPEVRAGIENVNRVEEAIRFLVDFGDDARAGALEIVAFSLAAQVEFLTHGDFFGEAQNAAVAADEQSFRGLLERGAGTGDPGCLDGHAEGHAVTLAEAVGNGCHRVFHGIAKFQTSMQSPPERVSEARFVVPTNNAR